MIDRQAILVHYGGEPTLIEPKKTRFYGPSSDLFNNNVRDFPHAMELYLAQHEDEFGRVGDPNNEPDPELAAEMRQSRTFLEDARRGSALALQIWQQHHEDGEEAVVDALNQAGLFEIAEALNAHDYNSLAI